MGETLHAGFSVPFAFDVHFTRNALSPGNDLLASALTDGATEPARALAMLDGGLVEARPDLPRRLADYFDAHHAAIEPAGEPLIVPGGERVKNEPRWLEHALEAIDRGAVCRHSYLVAIGGGALLDMAGYAAAIAHRGVRLIRLPTTTLAQGDSGVGVKSGVNARGKKNFVGAFAPPRAVINDAEFLTTLDDRDWRCGVAEAIKVAVIKDRPFFDWIESAASALAARDLDAMETLVRRSAGLHLRHITEGGDPFETGSSRPLDFGHWAAHRLETISGHRLRHGEAVAIGVALDVMYSTLAGRLARSDAERILTALEAAGFALHAPEVDAGLADPESDSGLLRGLNEFREHLGGRLTITLLDAIGRGVEAHQMDADLIRRGAAALSARAGAAATATGETT